MKKIAILGSTGSIGTQTLEVIEELSSLFEPYVLTAHNNFEKLIRQANRFRPAYVVIANKEHYSTVKENVPRETKVFAGTEILSEIVSLPETDTVLVSLVGFAGFFPTLEALKAGKNVALANKESLVVGGELLNKVLKKSSGKIYPVDSEHSAISQVLVGENKESIEKIILTASGGPFRGKTKKDLENVTVQEALKHPNWSMGAKITIDSATLMNKALEVIEAKWLFDLDGKQIEVVVHPQSIIHSLVQFRDGSIKAQLGTPDMRLPIQYALSEGKRPWNSFPRYDLFSRALTFEKPDTETFPSLLFAYECMEAGGNKSCILNAANEIAVEKFLQGKIPFLKIFEIIRRALDEVPFEKEISAEGLLATDKRTREFVRSLL